MESFAKLIHKSNLTYLPTKLPVHFYGLPDGKVYLLYARFFELGYNKSGVEYIIAVHEEFSFEYNSGKIFQLNNSSEKNYVYPEMVDKTNPKIKIYKVFRGINSFAEAYKRLDSKARKLAKSIEENNTITVNSNSTDKNNFATA